MKTFKININDELHARRKEGMTLPKNKYNENNLSKNSFDYDDAYAKRDYNDPDMKTRAKNRYFNLLNEIDGIYKKYNEEHTYINYKNVKKFDQTPESFSKLTTDPELKDLYETQERFYDLYPDEWIEEWDKEYNAKVASDQNSYDTDKSVIENCLTTDKLEKEYKILKPYIDKVSDVTANNNSIKEANKLDYYIEQLNKSIKAYNTNYDKDIKNLDNKKQNWIETVNKYGDGKSYEIKFSENDEIDKIIKLVNAIPMDGFKYVIGREDLLKYIDNWYTEQLNRINNYYNDLINSAKQDLCDYKDQRKNLNADGKFILDIPNIQKITHELYTENVVPTDDDIKLLKHNHQLNKYYINFDVKNENIDNLDEQVLEFNKYINLLIKIKQIFDVKANRETPKEKRTMSKATSKREDMVNKQVKALNKLNANYNFSDSISSKKTLVDVDKAPKKLIHLLKSFDLSFDYDDNDEDAKKDDYKSKSVKILEHKDANFQLIRIIDFDYIIFGDRKIRAEKLDSKNPRMLVATIEAGILASGKYGNNSDDSYFPKDHNKNAHVRLIYGDNNKFATGKSILDVSFEANIDDKDPNIKLKDEFKTDVLIPLQNGITYNGQTYKIGGLVTQEITAKETKDIAKKAEEANTNKAPEDYKTYFVGVKSANKFDALENSLYDLIYNFEQNNDGYIINYQVDKTDKLINVEFPVNFYNSVDKYNEPQKETIMIPTNYIQFDSYLDKDELIKLLEEKKVTFDAVYTAFEFNNSVLPDMYETYKKKNKIEYNSFEGYNIDVPKEQISRINNVKYDQDEIDEAFRTKTDTEESESNFNVIPANYNYDKIEKQYGFCYLGLKKNDGKSDYKYVLDNAQLIEDYITKALIEYTDKFNNRVTQAGDKSKMDYPYVKVAINNKLIDLMIAFTHNSSKMLDHSVKGLKSFGEGAIDTVNNTLKRYKIEADTMSVDSADLVPYVICVNTVNNHLKTTNMNNAEFNEYARNNMKSHIKSEEIKMFTIELKDDLTGEVEDIKKFGIKFDMVKSDVLDVVEGLVGDFTDQLLDSPIELLSLNISNLSINISLKYTNKDILNQMPAAIIEYMNEDGQCKIKGCTWYEKI